MIKVISINILKGKEVPKQIVEEAKLIENCGLEGDIHFGDQVRQICILRNSNKPRADGLCTNKFAENITIEDDENIHYSIGTRFKINEAILEITQVGKTCYKECHIYNSLNCPILNNVIFVKVIRGGYIRTQNEVRIYKK